MFYRYSELEKNSTFGNEVDPQGRRDKLTLVGQLFRASCIESHATKGVSPADIVPLHTRSIPILCVDEKKSSSPHTFAPGIGSWLSSSLSINPQ
jgi:hypothetical protein